MHHSVPIATYVLLEISIEERARRVPELNWTGKPLEANGTTLLLVTYRPAHHADIGQNGTINLERRKGGCKCDSVFKQRRGQHEFSKIEEYSSVEAHAPAEKTL
jgi:hypothetical protein